MKKRDVYLVVEDAFTAAQTLPVDINVRNPITALTIRVAMTNGSAMTEASTVKPHDEFTKIELIDGSDVLWSANMEEIQAYNAFRNGRLPYMGLTLEDSAVQTEVCHLMFGDKFWDLKHYLNPSDYNNLTLRITNSFTTAGATTWAASGHTITVIAHVIEEGAQAYEGFYSVKNMYYYSAVDGAVEPIDMPRDYPYEALLLQAYKTATRPDENLEHVKLSCDADSFIPIDIDMDDLEYLNVTMFGPYMQVCKKRMTNAGDIMYFDLFLDTWVCAGGGTTLYATHVTSVDCDQAVLETLTQT